MTSRRCARTHIKRRNSLLFGLEGEREIIGRLAENGSMASTIFCALRLTRASVKEVLRWLQGRRPEQVALANVLCATRFKYFSNDEELMPVACPRGCGGEDSFTHLLECGGLRFPKENAKVEDWLTLLWRLAKVAGEGAKAVPLPLQNMSNKENEEGEISLTDDGTEEELIGTPEEDQRSLEFDAGEGTEVEGVQNMYQPI